MDTLTRKRVLVALACTLAVAIVGAAGYPLKNTVRDEYPDAPFLRMPRAFPPLLRDSVRQSAGNGQASGDLWELLTRARRREDTAARFRGLSGDERAALAAVEEGKYIQARELVEPLLSRDPPSVPALFVLAQVELRGEANPAGALFVIRQARHRLQEIGAANPTNQDACQWYIRVLDHEFDILQSMDRSEEQIRVADLLAQVYEPVPWRKTWPLIKLRRFDEARSNIQEVLADGRREAVGWNGLCALEDKLGHRIETFNAGRELVKRFPEEAVFWSNFGLAAHNAFRFDEAERAFLRAGSLDDPYPCNPYLHLSLICLQQARLPEAADALKKAQSQRLARSPDSFLQDQAQMDMGAAILLHVTGRGAAALRLARRAYYSPDRAGFTSIDEVDHTVANSLLYWTVLDARLQELLENTTVSDSNRWQEAAEITRVKGELWMVERRLRKKLVGPHLVQLLRPMVPGTSEIESGLASWFRGAIVQIVPPGVAAAALQQARRAEDMPESVAYLDAMEAEVLLALNQPERALMLCRRALQALPVDGERLLRARVQAIAGAALLRSRDIIGARSEWEPVLQTFPQIFRMLHISLPLSVQHDGNDAARRTAERLCRSPRFREDPAGFPVCISERGGRIICEMWRAASVRHWETTVATEEDTAKTVVNATARFHERTMQPLADPSQLDLDSLDGLASVSQSQARIDQFLQPFTEDRSQNGNR